MLRAERILFLVAFVALGWYATARASVALHQASQSRELDELRLEASLERQDVHLAAPGAEARTPARTAARESRVLVGRLAVPRLGLTAMVLHGVDDRTLGRAVGHVPGTALPGEPGNVALAGHRDIFFLPLKDIRKGDRITLETPEGDFIYTVRDTRVVAPSDVSVLAPTETPTLTLITCYPFHYVGPAPDRFIVRATLAQ